MKFTRYNDVWLHNQTTVWFKAGYFGVMYHNVGPTRDLYNIHILDTGDEAIKAPVYTVNGR